MTEHGTIRTHTYTHSLIDALYADAVITAGLAWERRRSFTPRESLKLRDVLEVLGRDVVYSASVEHGSLEHIARLKDGTLVRLMLKEGKLSLVVAASTRIRADRALKRVRTAFENGDADDSEVDVHFWHVNSYSTPTIQARRLHSHAWADIAANYAPGVRAQVAQLAAAGPTRSGVTIWQGEPGTGKTTALRSLAREWRDSARVEVVLDPERLLTSDCGYLMHVLLADHGRKPRLIVLEDAGELVTIDARLQHGQAISRLLNVTDGMIGQGIDLQVLITTNEPIGRLHPAIRRPGRCVQHVEFEPLDREDAAAWLAERGCEHDPDSAASIAELYSILDGADPQLAARQPLGFEATA